MFLLFYQYLDRQTMNLGLLRRPVVSNIFREVRWIVQLEGEIEFWIWDRMVNEQFGGGSLFLNAFFKLTLIIKKILCHEQKQQVTTVMNNVHQL